MVVASDASDYCCGVLGIGLDARHAVVLVNSDTEVYGLRAAGLVGSQYAAVGIAQIHLEVAEHELSRLNDRLVAACYLSVYIIDVAAVGVLHHDVHGLGIAKLVGADAEGLLLGCAGGEVLANLLFAHEELYAAFFCRLVRFHLHGQVAAHLHVLDGEALLALASEPEVCASGVGAK